MDLYALLSGRMKIAAERNFSFARHTTIGCGGTAEVALYPKNAEELVFLLSLLQKYGAPYCFLGAGANVLPFDGHFEGAVIRFSRMDSLEFDGGTVFAGSGVTGGGLLREARKRRLAGLGFLTGIPMTVGGGVVMNAGVAERHLCDVVCRVVGVEKGKIRSFSVRECEFSEKTSLFQSGIAVTKAVLRASPATAKTCERERDYFREKRKHLPRGRSMGCVFVNPPGYSAGALIDACGFKGMRCGGAVVSDVHANFILSEGATSAEISSLIATVREGVFRKTGILLREEIRRIP